MCQFSAHPTRSTLAKYIDIPNIYPAGRLDADSEGLILLTDDGQLQHAISHPDHKQTIRKASYFQVKHKHFHQ